MHALSNSGIIDQNEAVVVRRNHTIRNLTTNMNSSEQHGLMISNNLVSEENNDEEEFENEKTNAKHRKTTIADAIDATDQGDKKKTKVKMVKKKKKSKKAKNAGNNLLSPVSDQN